jgi:ribose transport system substrate-binding protein
MADATYLGLEAQERVTRTLATRAFILALLEGDLTSSRNVFYARHTGCGNDSNPSLGSAHEEERMSGVQRGRGRTRRVVSLGVTLALGALLTAALTSGASASKSAKASAHSGPYTFVLSNNFLGNDWRPQVERLAQLTANIPPFKGKVNVKIVNSANTNEAQISDLNNIIQTKPAAILLIPGSTTALNPTIQRACNAGILVFTLSAPVAVPCVYNLNESFYQGNQAMGQWMAKALGGKGSIFIDQGVAGLGISQTIENGFLNGLRKYGPAITVAGKYTGNYAAGPEQSGIASLLAAHPNVSGIMTQGYCTPVFNALKAAGKPAIPAVCYGYNGEMTACGTGGHQCAILTNTPGEVQLAMKIALNILQGGTPPKHGATIIPYPMYLYVSPTPKVSLTTPLPVQTLKQGVNFFPSLAAGLSLPYALTPYIKYITPQEAAGK